MRVTFWGVRGSIPVPGAATARYGGNSACVEIRHEQLPPVVIDCGTGARALGQALIREHVRHVHLLFSHLHADHLFGFPFFMPLYTPGAKVEVGVPSWSDDEARERLARYVNGTFHPTRLRDVPADVTFRAVRAGRPQNLDGFDVRAVRLNHPGGSLGYRVSVGGQSIAYLSDTGPFAKPGEGLAHQEAPTSFEVRMLDFLSGCDVVVFDTMFDYDEYIERMMWGHSYPEYAIALCRASGVRHLVLFHHLPDATDADLDARAARYADTPGLRVTLAREGDTIEVA